MENTRANSLASARISRRKLAKGAAWAAPAVIVASAAPAYAVSGVPPTFQQLGGACKFPGNSCGNGQSGGYYFPTRVCNTDPVDNVYLYSAVSVNITYGTNGQNTQPDGWFVVFSPTFPTAPILPGTCQDINFGLSSSANSGNLLNLNLDLIVGWGHNTPGPDPQNHPPIVFHMAVASTPPNCAACL